MDVFIINNIYKMFSYSLYNIYIYNILYILLVYHLKKNTNVINYFIIFIKATKRHKRSTFVEVSSWIYDKVLS